MTKQKSRSGTSENSHYHHRCCLCHYRYKCFTILISSAFSRGFKADCPDGSLGKEKILEMYSMILPAGNAKVYTIEMMIIAMMMIVRMIMILEMYSMILPAGNAKVIM